MTYDLIRAPDARDARMLAAVRDAQTWRRPTDQSPPRDVTATHASTIAADDRREECAR